MTLTSEERTLLLLYLDDTREGTIQNIRDMEGYLTRDEEDLRSLADNVIALLSGLSDGEFDKLDLFPEE